MNISSIEEKSKSIWQNLQARRSVREFSPTPIPDIILNSALNCANSAPSGANLQPWHFLVVRDPTIKARIRKEAEKVESEFYGHRITDDWREKIRPLGTNATKNFLEEADTLIIVFYRTHVVVEHTLSKTYYPIESTGLATGFLLMALHQCGVDTLTHTPKPMHFLNLLFNKDSTFRPYMIVVAGMAHPNYQPPQITKKDIHDRTEFF
jgi:nitroreductase